MFEITCTRLDVNDCTEPKSTIRAKEHNSDFRAKEHDPTAPLVCEHDPTAPLVNCTPSMRL